MTDKDILKTIKQEGLENIWENLILILEKDEYFHMFDLV